jgi:hypothetical protein
MERSVERMQERTKAKNPECARQIDGLLRRWKKRLVG